jgi:hypothetical protein
MSVYVCVCEHSFSLRPTFRWECRDAGTEQLPCQYKSQVVLRTIQMWDFACLWLQTVFRRFRHATNVKQTLCVHKSIPLFYNLSGTTKSIVTSKWLIPTLYISTLIRFITIVSSLNLWEICRCELDSRRNKSGINSRNACYHAVQNRMSSCLLSKILKIKI